MYRSFNSVNAPHHAALTVVELIGKLAVLVPPPRIHLVRFHGVFAPKETVAVDMAAILVAMLRAPD